MGADNTLTDLIPTLYEVANVVSRELVGFIPAVRRNVSAERAAVGQSIRVPIARIGPTEEIKPGVTAPDTDGVKTDNVEWKITKSKAAPIIWKDEEPLSIKGVFNPVFVDQLAEGMRNLTNEIEQDLAECAKVSASRAFVKTDANGIVTPFSVGEDFDHLAGALRILENNGAPRTDLQFVLNSATMFYLRAKMKNLWKVNEAGSSDMLRNGLTDRLMNMAIRNSAGIAKHISTATGDTAYKVNGVHEAGVNSLAVKTGNTVVKAGDLFTIADALPDDGSQYVVASEGVQDSKIGINSPGLVKRVAADGKDIAFQGSYTPNYAFDRNALVLIARAPAVPPGGDMADDAATIVDPFTGLNYEIRVYRQYRQVRYEICMAWGVGAMNREHIATVAGA